MRDNASRPRVDLYSLSDLSRPKHTSVRNARRVEGRSLWVASEPRIHAIRTWPLFLPLSLSLFVAFKPAGYRVASRCVRSRAREKRGLRRGSPRVSLRKCPNSASWDFPIAPGFPSASSARRLVASRRGTLERLLFYVSLVVTENAGHMAIKDRFSHAWRRDERRNSPYSIEFHRKYRPSSPLPFRHRRTFYKYPGSMNIRSTPIQLESL